MLARDAKGEWTWIKGGGTINQANLQSLLKTLSSLHAVRWVGPTYQQHGFEKPQLAITFTTSLDDKSSHKLLVGGAAGDGIWFARAGRSAKERLSLAILILIRSVCLLRR